MQQYKTLFLEDIGLIFRQRIAKILASDREYLREEFEMTVDEACNGAYEELIAKFQRPFYKSESTTYTISYPETWWDAFKLRWFSKKLLKRFPPNYTTHDIEKAYAFPNIDIPPNSGRYFKMTWVDYDQELVPVENSLEDLKYFSCTVDHCPRRTRCENP